MGFISTSAAYPLGVCAVCSTYSIHRRMQGVRGVTARQALLEVWRAGVVDQLPICRVCGVMWMSTDTVVGTVYTSGDMLMSWEQKTRGLLSKNRDIGPQIVQ